MMSDQERLDQFFSETVGLLVFFGCLLTVLMVLPGAA